MTEKKWTKREIIQDFARQFRRLQQSDISIYSDAISFLESVCNYYEYREGDNKEEAKWKEVNK